MAEPLLEVVALDVADAQAAVRGGADRLEVVRDMASEGLVPTVETFLAIRDAVDVPLRVMLRSTAGFAITERELDELCALAATLRRAGMEECVVGFLTPAGEVDLSAVQTVLEVAHPRAWTFHRAFDHAADAAAAWKTITALDGLDAVLTAGSPNGLSMTGLCERLSLGTDGPTWVVGGGLRIDHVPALYSEGFRWFHVGRAVRRHERWDEPVDVVIVRRWREVLDTVSGG
ncbi:MAG: copper homeostasis protein CutC [Acidothermus cellulolyticus]|nr:copper homeostasis protein CutC [Acidothermus cellulolyticus]